MKTVIFDTETTALIQNSLISDQFMPRVIEFYACAVDDEDNVVGELEFLCSPGDKFLPLEDIIVKITHITDDMVRGQPMFSHFIPAVRQFIEDADAVVAHNLSYDIEVVNAEFARHKAEPVRWPDRKICTVEATEWYKGHRLNLGSLHEYLFGESFADAHRAKNDVQALTRCFCEIRRRGDI